MIKQILLAPVLALMLAGCGAFEKGGLSVGDVQSIAVKACAFLPTAETVGKIIAADSPALDTSAAVASAICSAVAPKAGPGAGRATVAGVPIEGLRVN
jgi:hypothetical protein